MKIPILFFVKTRGEQLTSQHILVPKGGKISGIFLFSSHLQKNARTQQLKVRSGINVRFKIRKQVLINVACTHTALFHQICFTGI